MLRLFSLLLTTVLLSAQTPVDTTFYAVTYLEVMPASKAAALTAFKQYRDTSRKDEGFVRIQLFEEDARAGHFSIIETWANQRAFDTHMAAAHTKEWRSKIDPIRLSDYDQRPYKNLSTGPAPAASTDGATFVIAHVDIGGQGTNAPELLRRLAEASRQENGNLRFDVLQHAMRGNHFTVIEAWQNERSLGAHVAAAHTRQYRDLVGPIAGSPLDQRIYKIVD